MTIASLNKPSKSINSSALLVHIEALLGLEQLGNSSASARIILELQVAHQIMWIEIELFNAEGCRHFALVIHVISIEQFLPCVVLENVAR
jgi:hypothetical protein